MKEQINRQKVLEKRAKDERERAYREEKGKLFPLFCVLFALTALLSTIVLIVVLSEPVAISYNRNTSMTENNGREFMLSARALLRALFGGSFTNVPNPELDALHFNRVDLYAHFAPELCPIAAVMTFLFVLFTAISIALSIAALLLAIFKKDYYFSIFSFVGALLSSLFMALSLIFVSAMNDPVFVGYQCDPSVCSIHTDWIFPMILLFLSLAAAIFALVRFVLLEKKRRGGAK